MPESYSRYFSYVLIGLIIFLTYKMVQPYFLASVTAGLIAYVFYPIYRFTRRRLKNESISSLLLCILVFLLVILPSFYLINTLVREIPAAYRAVASGIQNSIIMQEFIYKKLYQDFGATIDLSSVLQSVSSSLAGSLRSLLTSLPDRLLQLSMGAFFLYFFFKDGERLFKNVIQWLPFSKKNTQIVLSEVKKMADAVIYGQFITALIQSLLATAAYFFLGVKAPFFWGLVTFILAIIPMIGPAFVYVPISISLILGAQGDTLQVVKGVGLLLFGIGIISTVDNIIKPLVISDKVRMHPALVMIGVVSGLSTFGVVGVILGPLIMVLVFTVFNLYMMKEEIYEHINHPNSEKNESTYEED